MEKNSANVLQVFDNNIQAELYVNKKYHILF